MTADATARDGKAELAAIGSIALAGVEVEAGGTQPDDGEILERMTDGEDAQRLAGESGTVILGCRSEFKLQGALAGVPEARAAEVVARR